MFVCLFLCLFMAKDVFVWEVEGLRFDVYGMVWFRVLLPIVKMSEVYGPGIWLSVEVWLDVDFGGVGSKLVLDGSGMELRLREFRSLGV